MARKKPAAPPPEVATVTRITVNVTGFEERLRKVCEALDRSEGDLGRSALRGIVEMFERDGKLIFPLRLVNEDRTEVL